MPPTGLEETLRHLTQIGTLVKDREYRQVWRFEHSGKSYYLKFYPKGGYRDVFRRLTRGSPAMLEFTRLQWLQKAEIPAPRAVAALMGFQIHDRVGDAVVLEAIEPSIQLDTLLSELELAGEPIPDHLALASQLRDLVKQLIRAGLGHEDLHLGNILLHDQKLYLLDAYAVSQGRVALSELLLLGHSVGRYATRTDLLRGWYALGPGGPLPIRNVVTAQRASDWQSRVMSENRYFGRVKSGDWSGYFFKHEKHPRRWSQASKLHVTREHWEAALPRLLEQVQRDELPIIKRGRSGDVLRGEVCIGGANVEVVVKHPRRRYWYRYINEIGRGPRARREWRKAWKLATRNLPTAWPLLMLERHRFGYPVDSLIVMERVPGPTLRKVELTKMSRCQRDTLFRRVGRILRRIEQLGFSHFDAKASNWIVRDDPKLGPSPVLIDVDGIRQRKWTALGIQRLLRSMREHPDYDADDSLALCRGYAPFAKLAGLPDDVAAS